MARAIQNTQSRAELFLFFYFSRSVEQARRNVEQVYAAFGQFRIEQTAC